MKINDVLGIINSINHLEKNRKTKDFRVPQRWDDEARAAILNWFHAAVNYQNSRERVFFSHEKVKTFLKRFFQHDKSNFWSNYRSMKGESIRTANAKIGEFQQGVNADSPCNPNLDPHTGRESAFGHRNGTESPANRCVTWSCRRSSCRSRLGSIPSVRSWPAINKRLCQNISLAIAAWRRLTLWPFLMTFLVTFFFDMKGVVLGLVVTFSLNSDGVVTGAVWPIVFVGHDHFEGPFFSASICCWRTLIADWMTSIETFAAAASSSTVWPFRSTCGKSSSFGKNSTFVGWTSLTAVIDDGSAWNSGTGLAYIGLTFAPVIWTPVLAIVFRNLSAPVSCRKRWFKRSTIEGSLTHLSIVVILWKCWRSSLAILLLELRRLLRYRLEAGHTQWQRLFEEPLNRRESESHKVALFLPKPRSLAFSSWSLAVSTSLAVESASDDSVKLPIHEVGESEAFVMDWPF